MNTCPHCNKAIEEEPNGYTLVSVDGKAQKVVDSIWLAPKAIKINYHNEYSLYAKEIPVVCIVERET